MIHLAFIARPFSFLYLPSVFFTNDLVMKCVPNCQLLTFNDLLGEHVPRPLVVYVS